jgi:hypothetical protein
MNSNQQQRQRALEAIAAEERRLREVQERIRYLEARQDMMGQRVGVAQPVSNVRLEPRTDMSRITLEDLQYAMRISSRLDPFRSASVPSQRPQIDSTSRPGRRNSFCLPHGSSIMNARPNNPTMARLPQPGTMRQVPVQPLSEQKRENVLDHISAFVPVTTRPTYQEQYMPAPKKLKASHKGGGSFPLPSTREPKPLSIPLKSYWKLWEKVKGEVFRTRLHRSQVTILKDTSITGQYSITR